MRWSKGGYERWLQMLLAAVQRAGPVFVKIGQWCCTREDLFPVEVRTVFKRLYNEVDEHPFEDTLRILREDLGKDPYEVFDTIEPKTVGSGSIGQVHVATLKNNDTKVVVKVMHPNIVEVIIRDFSILQASANFVHKVFRSYERFDLPALTSDFITHLAAQLDFRKEAENLEIFQKNFAKTKYVNIPTAILSTQRMLVESYCEGVPANPEFLASLPEHARDVLADKGLNAWCQMLLHDNFIHGDMHPGNVLIDCTDPHKPTVTLIDVGLCQQLSPREVIVTRELMESFVRWKPELTVDSLWNMAEKGQKYADREAFTKDITFAMSEFRPNRNEEGAVTNILQTIFDCVRINRIHMDPPYVSLLFAVLVLESFIMSLNPDFDMVRHAAPWLVSEGHISKGVAKNLIKTGFDTLKREFGILTGRMGDEMEIEKLEGNKNVRISSSF